MTTEEIKARLKEKGLSERALAKRFKTSPSTVHFLIHRQLTSKRLEKRLARIIGISLEELRNGKTEQKKAS